jgi:hypothetical protein
MRTTSNERLLQATEPGLLQLPHGMNQALSRVMARDVTDLGGTKKPAATACLFASLNIWYTN